MECDNRVRAYLDGKYFVTVEESGRDSMAYRKHSVNIINDLPD